MVKVGWNNENIIGALRNVYRDNYMKKNQQFINGYFIFIEGWDRDEDDE